MEFRWVLIAIAAFLGYRFLSGGVSAQGSIVPGYPQQGMPWGGGVSRPAGTWVPAYPNYYGYPAMYQNPWWSGLFANYNSSDNSVSVGFNG